MTDKDGTYFGQPELQDANRAAWADPGIRGGQPGQGGLMPPPVPRALTSPSEDELLTLRNDLTDAEQPRWLEWFEELGPTPPHRKEVLARDRARTQAARFSKVFEKQQMSASDQKREFETVVQRNPELKRLLNEWALAEQRGGSIPPEAAALLKLLR